MEIVCVFGFLSLVVVEDIVVVLYFFGEVIVYLVINGCCLWSEVLVSVG